MRRLATILSKLKYIGTDFLDFILGLITGLVIMYVAMALSNKEKTISFMNIDTVLSLEEERSSKLENEQLFKGINFEKKLYDCKSQIEKKQHTKIIIVETNLKGLPDYSQDIYRCLIGGK